jgi:hypothetical protein
MVLTQYIPKQTWVPYVSRFLTGSFQVFLLVYYPVWIDKYGLKNKTLWLTILQICVPVGIFTGYGLTAAILYFDQEFYLSFEIQIAAVFLFLLAFILINNLLLFNFIRWKYAFWLLFLLIFFNINLISLRG